MGNHNIRVTNPNGGQTLLFPKSVTMEECKKCRPQDVDGWKYEIVNLNGVKHPVKRKSKRKTLRSELNRLKQEQANVKAECGTDQETS